MKTTTIRHTNPYPPTPNPNDLQHHHYQIHHHQILQSNFNHNSNIFWTIEQPKPPTPSQIKKRGTKWVSPKKEEIEGEIKEATLMATGGGEWWGRKPQPPPPIWVSQHTQGGDAVLPIIFSDPCCPPSTEASMIKPRKRISRYDRYWFRHWVSLARSDIQQSDPSLASTSSGSSSSLF